MAIDSVLDPSCKFQRVFICFPKICKPNEVSDENIEKDRCSLELLYDEYVAFCLEDSLSSAINLDCNNTSSSQRNVKNATGFDEILKVIREKKVVSPMKSELNDYLDQGVYVPCWKIDIELINK